MAHIVMAYIVIAYTVMAYIVMAAEGVQPKFAWLLNSSDVNRWTWFSDMRDGMHSFVRSSLSCLHICDACLCASLCKCARTGPEPCMPLSDCAKEQAAADVECWGKLNSTLGRARSF